MPFPRMSFPEEGDLRECSDWCKPIHMVDAAIAGQAFAKYFRVDDFMCMGKLHRHGRPDLILNKHYFTRGYLNLDATGHAYRYLPPPAHSSSNGQYRPHKDLVDRHRCAAPPRDAVARRLGLRQRHARPVVGGAVAHPDVEAWYGRRTRHRRVLRM